MSKELGKGVVCKLNTKQNSFLRILRSSEQALAKQLDSFGKEAREKSR